MDIKIEITGYSQYQTEFKLAGSNRIYYFSFEVKNTNPCIISPRFINPVHSSQVLGYSMHIKLAHGTQGSNFIENFEIFAFSFVFW